MSNTKTGPVAETLARMKAKQAALEDEGMRKILTEFGCNVTQMARAIHDLRAITPSDAKDYKDSAISLMEENKAQAARIRELEANIKVAGLVIEHSKPNAELQAVIDKAGVKHPATTTTTPAPKPQTAFERTVAAVKADISNLTGLARVTAAFKAQTKKAV